MKLRYRYRFYPTEAQARTLAQTFGCARYVYNWALEARERAYREDGENLSTYDLSKQLTALKREEATAWLAEVSSVPLQQAVRNLGMAYTNFFEGRAGRPRFKSRRDRQSATYTKNAKFKYASTDDGPSLALPKLGRLNIRWSRVPPSEPSSVTITRDAAGRYFVTLVCDAPRREAPPAERAAVGVDLGLAHFCTLSTGEKIENPRYLERDLKKLRRAQKALARKQKGSANREKARRRVARIHASVKDRRADFLHKLRTRLIREACFSRMSRVLSLWRKSARRSLMRAWILATRFRAFSRFALPFCFRASAF